MEDNSLLMIVLAFILGCMCSNMMKKMCGGRLVEGSYDDCESCVQTACSDYRKPDVCRQDQRSPCADLTYQKYSELVWNNCQQTQVH